MFFVSALLLAVIGATVVGKSLMAGVPLFAIAGVILVGGIRELRRAGSVFGRASGAGQRADGWRAGASAGGSRGAAAVGGSSAGGGDGGGSDLAGTTGGDGGGGNSGCGGGGGGGGCGGGGGG
ncbi:hypothetical protein ATM97_18865 [Nocardia sp. MH4]|uniref:hypothetical protein n=1 Tax=Nocardia sp. MH4 TaxID=1768677 RepID=UPI001C500858|nr:hypothetical protein [Nocardia sp. MH4]MBW0272276.1 hypothetical protein [Nocardia sp. MH4]